MKTRQGFVSNSSSTSFCIYGTWLDPIDEEKLKKAEQDGSGLEVYCPPYSDNGYYVGVSLSEMVDDETLAEFKEKVGKRIKKIFGNDVNLRICTDGWYDG